MGLALQGLLLLDRLDADARLAEDAGDLGQHARPVRRLDAQEIGRLHLIH
jgi:hypothetical protein